MYARNYGKIVCFMLFLATSSLNAQAQCEGWLIKPAIGAPGIDGTAETIAEWDPDGPGPAKSVLVVAGLFTLAGGSPANHVAAWDGERWTDMSAGLENDSSPRVLAVHKGELFGGGVVTVGHRKETFVRWNGSSWESMGPLSISPTLMASYRSELIAAGGAYSGGPQTPTDVMAWNGSSWRSLTGGAGFVGNGPHRFQVIADMLYVQGFFSKIGSLAATNLAAWNGTLWSPVPLPAPIPPTATIGGWNGHLVIASEQVQVVDGPSALPLGGQFNGPIYTVAEFLGDLFVIGSFSMNGSDAGLNNIARWDGNRWTPLERGLSVWGSSIPLRVFLLKYRDQLVAAGGFLSAGGFSVGRIASWDGTAWFPDAVNFDGRVRAFTQFGGKTVAAGEFSRVNGASAKRIASWDGHAWTPIGSFGDRFIGSLCDFQGNLLAGPHSPMASGATALPIRVWNGLEWADLPGKFARDPNTIGDVSVSSLTAWGRSLVAAGQFKTVGSVTVNNIAFWDGVSWHPLAGGFSSGVRSLVVYKGDLLAGAGFGSSLLRKDGNRWNAYPPGVNGTVYSMLAEGDDLYMAGVFNSVGSTNATQLAKWDGSSWTKMDTGWTGRIYAITRQNGKLVVGGKLQHGATLTTLLTLENGVWVNTFGSAMDDEVNCLLANSDELFVGGAAANVSRLAAKNLARWSSTGLPVVVQQPRDITGRAGDDISVRIDLSSGYSGFDVGWELESPPGSGIFTALIDGKLPGQNTSVVSGASTMDLTIRRAPLSLDAHRLRARVLNSCGDRLSDTSVVTLIAKLADFDGNALVDDDDFLFFAESYDIMECDAEGMPPDCPADLNADGLVDDSDFVLFVPQYDKLLVR